MPAATGPPPENTEAPAGTEASVEDGFYEIWERPQPTTPPVAPPLDSLELAYSFGVRGPDPGAEWLWRCPDPADKRRRKQVDLLVKTQVCAGMRRALDISPGGRLREFVPFQPPWCRTIGEMAVTLLTMRRPLADWEERDLHDTYEVAEQFAETGRRAVRDDGRK
jgi:hypothetical protein